MSKKVFAAIVAALIVAVAAIPCFATMAGGEGQEYQKNQMSWTAMTITNAEGANKTVIDYSMTSLSDTDGDGETEETASDIIINTDFSRCSRIVWNLYPPNNNRNYLWVTSVPFTAGTDRSVYYDAIEIGYTGIWYIDYDNNYEDGVYEYRAYTYETQTWSHSQDRGVVFWDAASVSEDFYKQFTILDNGDPVEPMYYFKHNSNMIAYVKDGVGVSTWDAFEKVIHQKVTTDYNTATGQKSAYYETTIESVWQDTTNITGITMTAHDFVHTLNNQKTIVPIDDPANLNSNLIHLTFDQNDEAIIRYRIWYTFLEKDRLETHTENIWHHDYLEGVYSEYDQYTSAGRTHIVFNPIPDDDIIMKYVNDGLLLENGNNILVTRLSVDISYRYYRADGVNPWYYTEPLLITVYDDEDIAEMDIAGYIDSVTGERFNTYPTPSDGNPFEVIDLISQPLNGFLNIPIFGFFTLGNLVGTIIAIGAVFVLLKIFAGG